MSSRCFQSPIGFREFNEDEYGKFIRTLSEEELIKAGSGSVSAAMSLHRRPAHSTDSLKSAAKSISGGIRNAKC